MDVDIVFLPAADIATYVGEGDVDLGITGEDVVQESDVNVKVLMHLGIGKCNLSVQAPADKMLDVKDLAGKRIATSFPNVTRRYFEAMEQPGNPTKIREISGSVEAACGLNLADGIVDLVETGTTMRAAGLAEVAIVMKSETVLIANPHSKHPEMIELLRKRIAGYMRAQSLYMVAYNIRRTDLDAVFAITPGSQSPSVMPLGDPNWVAVQALVPKKNAANIMDKLQAAGATDILLTAILASRIDQEISHRMRYQFSDDA